MNFFASESFLQANLADFTTGFECFWEGKYNSLELQGFPFQK